MNKSILILFIVTGFALAGCKQMRPAVEFIPKRSGDFVLTSSVVTNGGPLPVLFTGDGAGISPPLSWHGEPAGTESFVLIMHHVDPQGVTKWYWTLYNIPADVHDLPQNAQGGGIFGNNSVNHQRVYAPPHSKGPGVKNYTLTLYALSCPLKISTPPSEVSRAVLFDCMKNCVLDSAELKVTYDRTELIQRANGHNPSAVENRDAGTNSNHP
jgi:Raf kinase inhibitor-like YbhB/YbcL family protein